MLVIPSLKFRSTTRVSRGSLTSLTIPMRSAETCRRSAARPHLSSDAVYDNGRGLIHPGVIQLLVRTQQYPQQCRSPDQLDQSVRVHIRMHLIAVDGLTQSH